MAKKVSRGINELLNNIEDVRGESKPSSKDKVLYINIEKVIPNPHQPRKTFKIESLEELSSSIAEHGIIQPLIVTKENNSYIIVAGERRYRAGKMAKLKILPVIVKEYTELQIKEISLIENLQREDLNSIEEAEAIRELITIYKMTQEEIADKLGKARPSISNTLRLLHLTPEVQEYIREEKISAGHGRALIPIVDTEVQIQMAQKCMEENWSVREMEKRVKFYLNPETKPTTLTEVVREKMTLEMKSFVDDLTQVFATKIRLMGNEKKGRISIDYYSNEDLERIYEVIKQVKK